MQHSTCNKFGAMGYSGHWGAVSGMMLLTCARHNFVFPASAVDLQKGERCVPSDESLSILTTACADLRTSTWHWYRR